METSDHEKIIQFAISSELEAWRFYQGASKKLSDPHLKRMFADFAMEEKQHHEILKDILKSGSTESYFDESGDFRVAESVDMPELSLDMKPSEAFAIAMKKEEEAMNQYMAVANGCADPEKKKVFLDLASMERGHKMKMETAFVDIGYPEVW